MERLREIPRRPSVRVEPIDALDPLSPRACHAGQGKFSGAAHQRVNVKNAALTALHSGDPLYRTAGFPREASNEAKPEFTPKRLPSAFGQDRRQCQPMRPGEAVQMGAPSIAHPRCVAGARWPLRYTPALRAGSLFSLSHPGLSRGGWFGVKAGPTRALEGRLPKGGLGGSDCLGCVARGRLGLLAKRVQAATEVWREQVTSGVTTCRRNCRTRAPASGALRPSLDSRCHMALCFAAGVSRLRICRLTASGFESRLSHGSEEIAALVLRWWGSLTQHD